MLKANLTLLVILLLFVVNFTWATTQESLAERLANIESLVVSQPEQALTAIDRLKKSKIELTSTEKIKLIRHEVVANTYLNNHQVALSLIEEVKELAEYSSDKNSFWHYYNTKAIVYWHMDNIEGSLESNLKAYNVVKSIDEFSQIQAISEGNIGYAFIKLGFFKEAVTYLESALEKVLTGNNAAVIASTYNNLGEAYLGVKNYQKSAELLEKSLDMRLKHQLTFHSSFSYQNIGLLLYQQKQYQQAETAFNKAIEIREQAGFVKGLLVSKLALIQTYVASNQLAIAEQEVKNVILAAVEQKNNTSLAKAYDLQRKIFEHKKDYQSAYQALLLYQQTIEQVVSRKTSVKVASYLNTSEAISKDLNILSLKKNAEIKDLQVSSERQKTNIMLISGLCIFVILTIFLWVLQRSKQIIARSNSNLSETLTKLQQTQEQLVKSGKMSALTTLVSRMAHQVNTPLGIAVTGVSHIHEKVEVFGRLIKGGEVKKSEIDSLITGLNKGCELSLNSMNNVANLISQFKLISESLEAEKQQEFEVLDHLIKQTDLMLILLKQDKPVINVYGDKVLILGYPEALNKVISQLITNSIDHAFEGTLAPQIDIKIAKTDTHVEVKYQDNGKGIDPTIVNDVFEPFCTTKMGNKNLGMGLSIVYNLVVQLMQGDIQCYDKQGNGIIFCITLPLSVKSV
ncbi:tetratricopeptide repeat protein [Colwellia psychrerythraea]|uniref:histidine kinase n=1 Tax=Colwellia psychrerythraea TaxID=28229 RepID=A0A099L3V6_COLPS|nr:tetratricopeptide repeat protein [Colwellia psychrerythraea]KGJ96852.1 ATP-binding region ATPase domain protein [Colwellia psychrerythraea]